MGAEGEFAELAATYLRVYAICSPVTTIVIAADNYLRICGYIRGSMCLNLLMSALSGVLEFLFLGVFGFGIWGAAGATCAGMAVCAVIAYVPFFPREGALKVCETPVFRQNAARNYRLRQPEFPEQHRRANHEHHHELHPRPHGRRDGRERVRHIDVRRWICAAAALRYVRFAPARGRLQLGARGAFRRVRAIERCCFRAAAVVSLASAARHRGFPGNGDAALHVRARERGRWR